MVPDDGQGATTTGVFTADPAHYRCRARRARYREEQENEQLREIHEQSGKFVRTGQDADYLVLNDAFHNLTCDGAHNDTIAGLARDLRERLSPFRQSQSDAEGRRLVMSHDDHGRVIEAILESDADAAYARMRGSVPFNGGPFGVGPAN